MKLSILVPTLNEPYYIRGLKRLKAILDPQLVSGVEIKIHDGGRSIPTGTKRNQLISNSEGEYFVQIDSDDVVPSYYVSELLNAMEHKPDVISFIGEMTTNGGDRKKFVIKLGERYEERNGVFYRYCNHLCCFKRSAVERVKFRPIWFQEDFHYATEIRDKRLLKTEVHINKNMYLYDFKTKKLY
jgi:glycosyltransferase involved in cell wall biosynthesis